MKVATMEEAFSAPAMDEAIDSARRASGPELERFFELSSELLGFGSGGYLWRVNPAFEATLGYSRQELLSRPFLDFVHPDDRIPTREASLTCARRRGMTQLEHRCIRSDGSEVWLEWNVVADHQGWLYGAGRDVTQRRREQDRLCMAQPMLAASHRDLSVLAEQQAALRRVATMVARGVDPSQVFSVVADELARCLGGYHHAVLFRYQPDGAGILVAAGRSDPELAKIPVGERFSLDGQSVAATVFHTGRAARMASYENASGTIAARFRDLGLRTAVGAPITVEGRLWGAAIVGSTQPGETLPPDTEARVGDFTDLVATAIGNAATRLELAASRARSVAAGDDARRRLERELHDGAQQRSLALRLRTAEVALPCELRAVKEQIDDAITDLAGVCTDLREIFRGIHPTIVSHGGLGPALEKLARRSAVPVRLDVAVERRLSRSVAVAAYYVVAEALTNAAKYAHASEIGVRVEAKGPNLHLSIDDDGVGGADVGQGSGLIGLIDRVEALGGCLEIASRVGIGTSLLAEIPLVAE
jgi:PAS domain S-box-containing protein